MDDFESSLVWFGKTCYGMFLHFSNILKKKELTMYTEFLYTDVEILASVKIFYQNKGLEPYLPK